MSLIKVLYAALSDAMAFSEAMSSSFWEQANILWLHSHSEVLIDFLYGGLRTASAVPGCASSYLGGSGGIIIAACFPKEL